MPFDPFADMEARLEQHRKERLAAAGVEPDVEVKVQGPAPDPTGARRHPQTPYDQSQVDALYNMLNPPTPKEPGFIQKWGPTIARGAGMVATPARLGGPLGYAAAAATGAVGEGVAEGIEKYYGDRDEFSPGELAAAAVAGGVGQKMIGAIGGAKTLMQGAKAAAPYAVAQPFLHQGITNMQNPTDLRGFLEGAKHTNPADVAMSAAVGTGTGAAVGGLHGLLAGRAAAKAAPKTAYEIETTAQAGGQTLGRDGKGPVPVRPIPPIQGDGAPIGVRPEVDPFGQQTIPGLENPPPPATASYGSQTAGEAYAAEQAAQAGRQPSGARSLDFGFGNQKPLQSLDEILRGLDADEAADAGRVPYNSGDAEVFQEPRIKAQIAKENANRQVANAKAQLEEQPAVVTETYKGEGPDGRQQSVTRRWTPPVDEEGQPMVGATKRAPRASQFQSPPVSDVMPPEVPMSMGDRTRQILAQGEELLGRTAPKAAERVAPELEQLITPAASVAEEAAPFTERRVTPTRMGEEFRGTDLSQLLRDIASLKKTPDENIAANLGQTRLGGLSQAADPRDAKVAELMAQPFEMSPQEIVEGAQRMKAGFAERAGKNFEKPRGGMEPTAPEQALEGPGSPVEPTSQAGPTGTPVPLFKSREESAGAFYRELQNLFGKSKNAEAPVEQLGYQAARRQGRLAKAEAGGVNTAEVAQAPQAKPGSVVPPPAGPEPLSPEWFYNVQDTPVTGKEGYIHPDMARATAKEANKIGTLEALGFQPKVTDPARLAAEAKAGNPAEVEAAQKLLTGTPEEVQQGLMQGAKGKMKSALAKLLSEGSLGGEKGAVDPALLARVALTGTGAAVGAAADPFHNKMESALAGGAIGAAIPSLIPKIAALAPQALESPNVDMATKSVVQRMLTPEGQSGILSDLFSSVPHVLRANLLYSPNIVNNAFVGPWGSGFWNSLERVLAGTDPRAEGMLRDMNPVLWGERYPHTLRGAQDAISTAEGAAGERIGSTIGPNANKALRAYTETPGVFMTAGDHTTREIAALNGYTDEEQRMFTMTGEPELALPKAMVTMQRMSGPVGQVLQPFAKTIANIAEQGAHRTPILGEITQMMRETPDPLKLRLVQQGIGGALGGGAYLLGSEYPTDARLGGGFNEVRTLNMLRSFLSNAAGPYALPISMGLAAGLAHQKGKGIGEQGVDAVTQGFQELPLPSLDVINSYGNTVKKFSRGEGEFPKDAPQGMLPSALKQFLTYDKEATGKKAKKSKTHGKAKEHK